MLSERNFARQIDLTSLQLFVAVCESGSIGRAAEREFIAASAISKRLSDLEGALGTTLLHRHTRGVRLTPAGEGLLHHARAVLFGLEKMQIELAELQNRTLRLSDGYLDLDLLDEQVRDVLGYIRADEIVIR